MKAFPICIIYLCALYGCTEAAISAPDTPETVIVSSTQDESFQDVLEQYQALNARLDHVTYRLRAANADLCPQTNRSLGLTVHTIEDYPEDIRELARLTLSVSESVSVRTVWPGSPSEKAGIRKGDTVTGIAGYGLPIGPTAKKLYEAVTNQSLNASLVDVSLQRAGEMIDLQLHPETLCGYESRILWVDQINAFTNGETLLITSELLRITPNDNDLAMFVAHEMAHAIAGHVGEDPSQALELEADRMGLVLMARAGFDIESAVTNWPNMSHPHFSNSEQESSHPSLEQRLENFKTAKSRIRNLQITGQDLGFD